MELNVHTSFCEKWQIACGKNMWGAIQLTISSVREAWLQWLTSLADENKPDLTDNRIRRQTKIPNNIYDYFTLSWFKPRKLSWVILWCLFLLMVFECLQNCFKQCTKSLWQCHLVLSKLWMNLFNEWSAIWFTQWTTE